MRHVVSTLGLMLLLNVPGALAVDGATPVWEPLTITEPGRYVLTRNVVSLTNPVITIASDDVHLDLNGFKIEGDVGVFASEVILVSGSSGITIENGVVVGGGAGVLISTASDQFTVRRLTIHGGRSGIATSSGSALGLIENNIIRDSTDGIAGAGDQLQIRGNLIQATAQGISIDGCGGCLISGNTVYDSSDGGIIVSTGNGNAIVGNVISSCVSGIRVSQSSYHVIEGNISTGNSGYGLELQATSTDCVVRRNTVRGNGGTGCANPPGNADFCDLGTGNTSYGDNFMPDLR